MSRAKQHEVAPNRSESLHQHRGAGTDHAVAKPTPSPAPPGPVADCDAPMRRLRDALLATRMQAVFRSRPEALADAEPVVRVPLGETFDDVTFYRVPDGSAAGATWYRHDPPVDHHPWAELQANPEIERRYSVSQEPQSTNQRINESTD